MDLEQGWRGFESRFSVLQLTVYSTFSGAPPSHEVMGTEMDKFPDLLNNKDLHRMA